MIFNICKYFEYIVAKQLYNDNLLTKMCRCSEKYKLAEILLEMKKYGDVIKLVNEGIYD